MKYILFAGLATGANLLSQYFSFRMYSGKFDIFLALTVGTFVGLVVKYLLDKKFIFYYETKKKSENAKKFVLYSFTGVFTTIIFWSFELGFHFLLPYDSAKYFGAGIGLSMGYVVKYFLDKKYVFRNF